MKESKIRTIDLKASGGKHQLIVKIMLIGATIYGLYQAIDFAWVGDDAFISFRYAKNLIDGHGLVFNAREYVEGYTNFLWTILIATGMLIGLEPVGLAHILSIFSYMVTVGAFVYLSYRLMSESKMRVKLFLPLTALALLVHRDIHVFATSGLETSFTTCLITIGFVLLVLSSSERYYAFGGLALILAAMARPDAMIFYCMGLPYILLSGRPWKRRIIAYLLPLVVIYMPYWLWRFSYYGWPFPNTYYAKSANLSWYSQGWQYFWVYLKTYYVLALIPAAWILIIRDAFLSLKKTKQLESITIRAGVLALLFAIPFIFYVVRTGGDFMFARFFIPVTPLLFFSLEYSITSLIPRTTTRLVTMVLLVLLVFMRWNQFPQGKEIIAGITDEAIHYSSSYIEQSQSQGEKLRSLWEGLDITVAFYGTKAVLIYYAEPNIAIESEAGLTDEFIAHQPIIERTRPGHEKNAPLKYLYERKVNFILKASRPKLNDYDQLRIIKFTDNLYGFIVIYDKNTMEALNDKPGVEFINFTQYLNQYIVNMPSLPTSKVQKDFNFFVSYYFAHNNDPELLEPFRERLH